MIQSCVLISKSATPQKQIHVSFTQISTDCLTIYLNHIIIINFHLHFKLPDHNITTFCILLTIRDLHVLFFIYYLYIRINLCIISCIMYNGVFFYILSHDGFHIRCCFNEIMSSKCSLGQYRPLRHNHRLYNISLTE